MLWIPRWVVVAVLFAMPRCIAFFVLCPPPRRCSCTVWNIALYCRYRTFCYIVVFLKYRVIMPLSYSVHYRVILPLSCCLLPRFIVMFLQYRIILPALYAIPYYIAVIVLYIISPTETGSQAVFWYMLSKYLFVICMIRSLQILIALLLQACDCLIWKWRTIYWPYTSSLFFVSQKILVCEYTNCLSVSTGVVQIFLWCIIKMYISFGKSPCFHFLAH